MIFTKVSEIVGHMEPDYEGDYLKGDEGFLAMSDLFPEEAQAPSMGKSGRRGKFKITVEFEPEGE